MLEWLKKKKQKHHCISQESTFKLYGLLELLLTTQEVGEKMIFAK